MSDRSFMDKSWDAQRKVEKKFAGIGSGKYARVLKMARKPDQEEVRNTSKIVLIGIGVIGGIGFIMFLIIRGLLGLFGAN